MGIYLGLTATLLGIWVSHYLYRKKRAKTKLVCPLRSNCDKVVGSKFGATLGVGNEAWGLLYYSVLAIAYALLLVLPGVHVVVHFFLLIATIFGVLFSLYLISIQALVIRAWCAWCMLSIVANILLVITLFYLPSSDLFAMIGAQKMLWVLIHNVGFILGIGAATITDVFFFRFLKDSVISEEEKGTMDMLTSVIWTGLAIVVASGIMLYLPSQALLDASPKFILKVMVVCVVIANGFLLNLLVAPRMRQFSFERTPPAAHYRRLAFALGGVSIVSWYSAFILGSLRAIPLTLIEGMLMYGALLFFTLIGSQFAERLATQSHTRVR